ncbi:MAG: hypothetical protein M3136_07515 [Thermoproteota archaeon]|nr:hypothetical protein [Thermoproteota archaeon]
MLALASSFLFPATNLAYAHTFSTSESAEFLSLVEQIRAETALVTLNLQSNNVTLAQAHAQKAVTLPDNLTITEIRERNNRIADSLVAGLEQLEQNVTSLAAEQQEPISQDRIEIINQSVASLNDVLAEAVTVRVESDQHNNATMWASVLADLVNVVLSDYGNATGASFDLTEMANLAGMGGMEMDQGNNMTMMMTTDESMQMSDNSSGDNMTTMGTNFNSSTSNMTTTIVDEAAYQSAQYLTNNTLLQLFSDTLKPLTISANETTADSDINTTAMTQEGQETSSPSNNVTSNIDELEAGLMQLSDAINGKANPYQVMIAAHVEVHPLLIQIYGLTIENQEGEEEHTDHTEGQ